jgi:structural maintenance of chromosome 2
MKYVFGDYFVCEQNDVAKKLAFDPSVKMKCVTLDGVIYNPSGVLSGGYYDTT